MAVHPLPQSAFERRIPLRLLAYWEKLRQGRPMPAEGDIVSDDIRDLWDNCFLIHVKKSKSLRYSYNYLGREIMRAYGHPEEDLKTIAAPHAGMIDAYMTVVRTRKPLIESGEFTNRHNQTVRYRQCLLPLGEGEEVQAIFGALHLRVFSVE